ncbi:hypothetical protein GW17_00037688 [Ensete ventricosum]|nr:hypothetical protein GW17_00037688 [Ensete ventricosum]
MSLITHNRIYVCIGASPCPVIVDLVIINSVGSSHHHARWHCTCPSVATLPRGGHPYGRHLHGHRPCRSCRCWPPPLRAVPLPAGCLPTGIEPAVDRPLRAGHGRPYADRWQQPLAGAVLQPATLGRLPLRSGRERAPPPCGLALAAASHPFAGGLATSDRRFAWGPWLQPVAPARGLVVAIPGCPLQGLPSL